MRILLAQWLNTKGNQKRDAGNIVAATRYYEWATRADPNWSVPWYNLGLSTKHSCDWKDSLRFNQRAIELNPKDEAAWWNLGIAATALHDWPEARRAWGGFGIEIDDGPGEVSTPHVTACVRLDAQNSGEVVWGKRLDPARIDILSVPLPESGHRYHDIVLHDGAENGTRMLNGAQVPIFDELEIWETSEYSTFEVNLFCPREGAQQKLVELCEEADIGIDDWSGIRILCAACSMGTEGIHDCKEPNTNGTWKRYGFAAMNSEELSAVLHSWRKNVSGADFGEVKLVLAAEETCRIN
jgi:hypothetical protein